MIEYDKAHSGCPCYVKKNTLMKDLSKLATANPPKIIKIMPIDNALLFLDLT